MAQAAERNRNFMNRPGNPWFKPKGTDPSTICGQWFTDFFGMFLMYCFFPQILQGGAPQVISWFIILLTIDISPINHSYWSYKPI